MFITLSNGEHAMTWHRIPRQQNTWWIKLEIKKTEAVVTLKKAATIKKNTFKQNVSAKQNTTSAMH